MRVRLCFVVAFAALLAGCATVRAPTVRYAPPPPSLQLLSLDEIQLPADCTMRSGATYRTSFRVDIAGRTTDVQPDVQAPACVREALSRWVASFRYQPPAEPTESVIDWLPVVARRGG